MSENDLSKLLALKPKAAVLVEQKFDEIETYHTVHRRTWGEIATAIGLPRATLYRHFQAIKKSRKAGRKPARADAPRRVSRAPVTPMPANAPTSMTSTAAPAVAPAPVRPTETPAAAPVPPAFQSNPTNPKPEAVRPASRLGF